MAKIDGEPHEAYETRFRHSAIDFISAGDSGPLRAQELTGDERLRIPPAGATIWQEWNFLSAPEQERLIREVEQLLIRPLARRALHLANSRELPN